LYVPRWFAWRTKLHSGTLWLKSNTEWSPNVSNWELSST